MHRRTTIKLIVVAKMAAISLLAAFATKAVAAAPLFTGLPV